MFKYLRSKNVFIMFILLFFIFISGCTIKTASQMKEKSGNIVLLTYHGIKEELETDDPWQFWRKTDDFNNDMITIKESGVSVKSYNEVIDIINSGEEIVEPTIIIQFDDGLLSDYKFAYPILSELNLKATFFISTGRASKAEKGFMSWEQIKEMYEYRNSDGERLFEFGGHGIHHTNLNQKDNESYDEWVERLTLELEQPQNDIEKHLGYKPNLYALPFGSAFGTKELEELSKQLNYDLMRGWKEHKNNFTFSEPDNIVFFPVYNNTDIQSAINAALNEDDN
mgnify:CR=1 FL=1